MRIAVIGASGRAGSAIAAELAARGHDVTGIARHPERIAATPGLMAVAGDADNPGALAALLAGHDAAVSAIFFSKSDAGKLIEAVKQAGVPRYAVVGGAASLEVTPSVRLFDSPDFPDAYREEAGAGIRFLEALRQEAELDWVFLSPSAEFDEGPRTGQFRIGGDQLLTGPDGSRISFADYAIALADELERPAHHRQRFTVGY